MNKTLQVNAVIEYAISLFHIEFCTQRYLSHDQSIQDVSFRS